MKRKNELLFLFLIVLFAFFLRIWHVNINPPAISWDEASIGYNAYSILKTGKDEHGKFLPLDTFAAFGDYKPPVPIYLTVPFVAVFGLNELAVRLPSVLAGALTVLVLSFLVLELFGNKQVLLALLSSFLLAISPWHIMLSRAGFEGNIALFFITLGVYLVLHTRWDAMYLYVCFLPFVAGVYTFNSARYAGPVIALASCIYVYTSIHKHKKQIIWGIIIACMALLPITPHLLSKQARLRFEEVSIFTDLRTVLTSNTRRQVDGFSKLSTLVHNRRIGYAREYLIHFFDNLEPRFLFIHGDGNPKFSIQDSGQLLLVTAPFLVYGFFAVFADYPAAGLLLLVWLIASIAPAAVARETPHALRIENSLPVFIIFIAYGISFFRKKFYLFSVVCLLITMNFLYFWHNYTVHYPKEYSGEWQYGYKQAIELAESKKSSYDTIVLTESIGRPYIYALFYEQYNPVKFWQSKDASFDAAGFYNVYGFDTYKFTKTGVGKYPGKVLYILSPKDVPSGAHIIETIALLNGSPVLVAFD
jgi:4-amino-4-deoxy-L-arabinose transferase-like glycosyltransferase